MPVTKEILEAVISEWCEACGAKDDPDAIAENKKCSLYSLNLALKKEPPCKKLETNYIPQRKLTIELYCMSDKPCIRGFCIFKGRLCESLGMKSGGSYTTTK